MIKVLMLESHRVSLLGYSPPGLLVKDEQYEVSPDLASTMIEQGWAEEVGQKDAGSSPENKNQGSTPENKTESDPVSGEIEILQDIDWANPEGVLKFVLEKGQVKKVPDEVPLDAAQVFMEKDWARPVGKKGNALVQFFKKLGGK